MLQGFLKVTPVETRGQALRAYVPLVLWNRGVAFLRILLVARILGEVGKAEFGRYNISLEFINWIVPVVMLGVDSIAERYAGRHQREGNLAAFLNGHLRRLVLAVTLMLAALLVLAGPLGHKIFQRDQDRWLIVLAALDIAILAVYQWVAASLRGLRAYQTSAGMETIAAGLLMVFSIAAAWIDGAPALLIGYGISNLLPLAWYGMELRRFARAQKVVTPLESMEHLGWFGAWSRVRIILWMSVGFVALKGVEYLTGQGREIADIQVADYTMTYRVAQSLMYVALTLWSSTYAMAAARHSAGSARQANYQFLQVGKLGGIALLMAGVAVVVGGQFVVRLFLPAYSVAVGPMLSPVVGLFFWYGMMALLVSVGDLQERPWAGAAMWGLAVIFQLAAIVIWGHRTLLPARALHLIEALAPDGKWAVLWGSIAGAGTALLAARWLLHRQAWLLPVGGLTLAGAGFFMPIVPGAMWGAGIILVLASSGVLLRRHEWKLLRKLIF